MSIGIIVEDKKIYGDIRDAIQESFIYEQVGVFDANQVDEILVQAGRVDIRTFIISLEAITEEEYLAKAIRKFKVQRPNARIILIATDREVGDKTILQLVNLAVFDIIAPSTQELQEDEVIDYGEYIQRQIEKPATFASAERWRVGDEEERTEENKKQYEQSIITKEKIMGSVVVGVTSGKVGAGSTFVSIQLAHFLSQYGKTAVVEMVDPRISNAAFYAMQKEINQEDWVYNKVHYFGLLDERKYNEILQMDFTYIVVDFGHVFSYSNSIERRKEVITSKYINELARANLRVVVSGAQEWELCQLDNTLLELLKYAKKWSVLLSPAEELGEIKGLINKSSNNKRIKVFVNSFAQNVYDQNNYESTKFFQVCENIIPKDISKKISLVRLMNLIFNK